MAAKPHRKPLHPRLRRPRRMDEPVRGRTQAPTADEPQEPTQPQAPAAGNKRVWLGSLRLSRGNALVAVLTLVLGVAMVAQARSTASEGLEGLRQSDLIQLLDDATQRAEVLESEIIELEADRDRLGGVGGDEAAAAAAQQRLDAYRVLAGTVPVRGPGVVVEIDDPDRQLSAEQLMSLVQELRDAGAEAIQIGTVRVVASTWFGVADSGHLTVSGRVVLPPYEVTAVGDAHTLSGALAIPGGFNDSARRVGAQVETLSAEVVLIDALHRPTEHRYAQPMPSDDR